MERAVNFNGAAIVAVKGSDYRIHFWYISRYHAINIMKNYDLNKRVDYYQLFTCLCVRKN